MTSRAEAAAKAAPAKTMLSNGNRLLEKYREVRRQSHEICSPLAVEDYVVQTMPDVSPTKWHLAHTSWFFETFVLETMVPGYRPFHPQYRSLFNSYYNMVGPMHLRPERGFLSRPTVKEVYAYRKHVDEHMETLLSGESNNPDGLAEVVILGINHCQQHQELMLTDIKHVFSRNPLLPEYRKLEPDSHRASVPHTWLEFDGGMGFQGHQGEGFAFDNESPRHRVLQEPFSLGNRPVTNREYLEFIHDGGYRRPELWLSDGWYAVQENRWIAPAYWEERDGRWFQFTLGGLREVADLEPVCHVSYYEADAFASWRGVRLPGETEWELAAESVPVQGNLLEEDALHPVPARGPGDARPLQMFGDVWEWTRSAYMPYPGYRPVAGALGEYNGKFMSGQMVLRGGSCVTPRDHLRKTYRNFFPPHTRWQFMGIRLAKDS